MKLGAVGPQQRPAQAELIETARELEAVFVRQMFEEMAKTVESSGLFEEAPGADMYEQWFRSEVADRFAAGGGTGLGDRIAEALGAKNAGTKDATDPARRAVAALRHQSTVDASLGLGREAGGRALTPRPHSHAHGHDHGLGAPNGLTSGFGKRVHPVTGQPDFHRGIDLRAAPGTGVRAPFAGVVESVGQNETLGRFVWVEHANGFRSLFGHLDRVEVGEGQRIPQGATLGASGATGRVTGPHLHYGLYRGTEAVDPLRFLPKPGQTLLSRP